MFLVGLYVGHRQLHYQFVHSDENKGALSGNCWIIWNCCLSCMNVKDGVLKDEQSLVVTTVVFQLSFVLNYSIG